MSRVLVARFPGFPLMRPPRISPRDATPALRGSAGAEGPAEQIARERDRIRCTAVRCSIVPGSGAKRECDTSRIDPPRGSARRTFEIAETIEARLVDRKS